VSIFAYKKSTFYLLTYLGLPDYDQIGIVVVTFQHCSRVSMCSTVWGTARYS